MQQTQYLPTHLRRVLAVALVCVLSALFVSPAWGLARDRDGSRLRAKRALLNNTLQDTLSAPKDRADWRYVELSDKSTLRVSLTTKNHTSPVKLKIFDSQGRSIQARAVPKPGVVMLQTSVTPGVYYIGVEIEEGSAEYSIKFHVK